MAGTGTGTGKEYRHTAIYSMCIVLLLLSNAVILWRYIQLQEEIKVKASQPREQAVQALMLRPMQDSNGNSIVLADTQAQYVLLFAFTQSDCMPCLSELTTLNRIGQIRTDIKVYGLMGYASPDEERQTQQNFDISFPLLEDETGEVLKSLHLPQTPWKIVFNTSSKQIVYEDLPSLTDVEREAFLERIAQLGR